MSKDKGLVLVFFYKDLSYYLVALRWRGSCFPLVIPAWATKAGYPTGEAQSVSLRLPWTGANPGHTPAWSSPNLSRREPQSQKILSTASLRLLGHSSEQNSGWQRLKGSLGCSCQCDRRLQDFVKQSDEPSQIEAPNAIQLCNWDGNGPMRGGSLGLTFGESCSRRLYVGGRKKHYK